MGTPPTIQFASLGMADSLILMVLALVVFGPRRLPQIGRQIGKLMYEFRKASNDFKYQMEEELRTAEEADRRKKEEERVKALAVSAPSLLESQVSEAKPGEVGAASPYAGEDVYPPVIMPDGKLDQGYPRIQPPSTGEPVAAARPFSPQDEPAKPASEPEAVEQAVPEPIASEQAAHHD
jgi:sec-independent protein translocase protein TatB